MMNCMRPWFLALLLVVPLHAAGDGLDELIDRARSAPAEFAADALLRIAESGRVTDRPARVRLLGDAFERAAGAQQQYKRRALSSRYGSQSAFLNRAYAQNLDTTSLRCRAVRAMLTFDPGRARRMFAEMAPPQLGKLTCDDFTAYDVSLFYDTLAKLLGSASTAQQTEQDEALQFAQRYLGLQSPAQVEPAARLLAAVKWSPAQFTALIAGFAGSLQAIDGDDRSFTASVERNAAGAAIAALAEACRTYRVSPVPLIGAYRAYLVKHMTAARCADAFDTEVAAGMSLGYKMASEWPADPVQFFNDSLKVEGVPAIAPSDATPAKLEGAAGGRRACETGACRAIAQQYTALLFGDNGAPLSNEQKNSAAWQARLREFLAALAAWKEDSGLAPAEYFQQKCALYSDTVNLAATTADRELVLQAFAAWLRQNQYQRESRMEWFLPVNALIARVFLDPLGLAGMREELRHSEDPIIALYADLEALAPRRPDQALSLM